MKKLLFFLYIIFVSHAVLAQTPSLQALVSSEVVVVNKQLTITFRFNSSGEGFTPPNNLTDNFRVLSGPNKSSQMSFVNGKMSSSVSYSYVISPIKEGNYNINPAKIQEDGTTYTSPKVKIKVVKPSKQQQQAEANDPRSETNQRKQLAKNLYVKLVVSKTKLYQGEQLVATYKLYNRTRLVGIEGQRLPEFDGFYTNDIKIENNNHTREQVGNAIFDVYTLKKTIIIPQRSGKLQLIPLEVDAQVQIQDSKPVNTWFGPQYQYKNITVSLKSNPVTINVKPLPKEAPADFTGAVGKFNFKATASPATVNINDAITFQLKVTGSGNLPLLDPPTVVWPQEFEVYDPKLTAKTNNATGAIKGSKTWEYLTIPRAAGTYEIPPISFVYFNPATRKYEEKTIHLDALTVTGNVNGADAGMATQISKQNVSRLGTDIRFIHTAAPSLTLVDTYFYGSFWFYLWLIIPIIIGLIAYFIIKKQTALQADTISLNKRRATKMAKTRLKQAQKSLSANDLNEFYQELSNGLFGYIAHKFNLGTADLNKPQIRERLSQSQVSAATIESLMQTIDYCEMARFAPSADISNQSLLTKAEEIIVALENEIK